MRYVSDIPLCHRPLIQVWSSIIASATLTLSMAVGKLFRFDFVVQNGLITRNEINPHLSPIDCHFRL